MFRYIIKRLLIFIPTLFAVSLVAFALSKLAPGDPVELIIKGGLSVAQDGQAADLVSSERRYREKAEQLGLNLPTFYFALSTAAQSDTLYKVVKKDDRETLQKLASQYGNWPQIAAYYKSLKNLEMGMYAISPDSANYSARRKVRTAVNDLFLNYKDNKISRLVGDIEAAAADSSIAALAPAANDLASKYAAVKGEATPYKNYIPDLKWYGLNNQYHRWASNFLKGDFGLSYLDERPVASKMWEALRWTLIINIVSIFIAYLLSIPLGVSTAIKKDTTYDRVVTTLLFVMYSLPSFWIGTLLIVFFTTPEYGAWLDWFPTGNVIEVPKSASFFVKFKDVAHHLVLPVICVTYGSLAFISRQMRGGMLSVIRQDYIRTARAKGLDNKMVIWKHAFRNSLFPVITLFASIFPAAIAGSVAIEVIYNIPGMGKLAIDSINARDWPVVFTILTFAAILTMVGNLIADMLYAVADPRVSFDKK